MLKRRMIIFVGRGRIGKSTLANAVFEEMQHRKHPVTAWDLDRAPMLSRYVDARRPSDASDRSRRVALEDAIHETIGGDSHAIVDLGGDDPMVNQVQDKLPDMTEMFADAGLETIACHVVGPQLKDLAYFKAVQGTDTFARQVVALNHGMAPDGVDPDAAFALVRKSVGDTCPKLAVRQLPPEAIDAMLAREKGQTLTDLAENSASGLKFVNRMVLMSWLNLSIAPLVDILMEDPPPLPAAA